MARMAAASFGTGGEPPRSRATPLSRRLAADHGIDLERVVGTGLGGRITSRDVAQRIEQGDGGSAAPAAAMRPGSGGGAVPTAQPFKETGRSQADRGDPAPTAWMLIEADVSAILERLGGSTSAEGGAALLAAVLRAVAVALREHPMVNAAWEGNGIRLYGMPVLALVRADRATEALVIARPDELSRREVVAAVASGVGRQGTHPPTFTIVEAGSEAAALARRPLPPRQAAGLVVGRPVRRLVAGVEGLALRSIAPLALVFDHRVLDGAPAGQFLQTLRRRLEAGPEEDPPPA